MELAYQEYVKRLNYEPYQWPPDISIAELHSRVSEQGPVNPSGAKCPCCNFQSKKEFKGWITRDITEDCRGYGTAIPAFFGLLMYYTMAIFVVICLNTIYPLWAVYYTCDDLIPTGEQACLQFGLLYYVDLGVELSTLSAHGDTNIVDNLIILETVTFYFLVIVNLSSLVYLYYMEKREKAEAVNQRYNDHGLILGNLPETDPEKIKAKLNAETKLHIVDIVPLKEFKKCYDLFHKRNLIYYKLMSKLVMSKDPRQQRKLNQKLVEIQNRLIVEKKIYNKSSHSNLLVFFKNSFQRTAILEQYSLSQLSKLQYGTKQVMTEWRLQKEQWDLPIYVIKVPETNEIKWENAGENIKSKLAGRIITFFIAMGLIGISLLILYGPIGWSLSAQSSDPANLTTFQKVLPIIISFILFGISVLFHNHMGEVAKRRFPLSEFEASKFVLMWSMFFHLLFYIVIPVAFFAIPSKIVSTTRLFVIAQQARTFIVLQLILNIIDVPYQYWKNKKIKSLSDQREGFKYYQRQLHRLVEYRDFPIEYRIQSMFKIWSFALFYAFYLPYMVIYIFIALIILYILEKHNFYLHYALRRVISLQLQKSFLIYFVNFFAIFQCFSYCYDAPETWMITSAIAVTAVLLVANIVFWKYVQPRYSKKKHLAKGKQQQLLEEHKAEKDSEKDAELIESVKRAAQEYRVNYEIFLESNTNDNLDDEVDEYIKTLDKEETVISQEERESIQKFIELPESDLERDLQ